MKPLIHSTIGQCYRAAVSQLRAALNKDGSRAEATQHLRTLIEKVVMTPMGAEEELQIDLYGDLAGILNMLSEDKSAMKSFELLDRLCLSPVNDNSMPIHTDIDRIGSGGWMPTKQTSSRPLHCKGYHGSHCHELKDVTFEQLRGSPSFKGAGV